MLGQEFETEDWTTCGIVIFLALAGQWREVRVRMRGGYGRRLVWMVGSLPAIISGPPKGHTRPSELAEFGPEVKPYVIGLGPRLDEFHRPHTQRDDDVERP